MHKHRNYRRQKLGAGPKQSCTVQIGLVNEKNPDSFAFVDVEKFMTEDSVVTFVASHTWWVTMLLEHPMVGSVMQITYRAPSTQTMMHHQLALFSSPALRVRPQYVGPCGVPTMTLFERHMQMYRAFLASKQPAQEPTTGQSTTTTTTTTTSTISSSCGTSSSASSLSQAMVTSCEMGADKIPRDIFEVTSEYRDVHQTKMLRICSSPSEHVPFVHYPVDEKISPGEVNVSLQSKTLVSGNKVFPFYAGSPVLTPEPGSMAPDVAALVKEKAFVITRVPSEGCMIGNFLPSRLKRVISPIPAHVTCEIRKGVMVLSWKWKGLVLYIATQASEE